jgi:hypothetical protein
LSLFHFSNSINRKFFPQIRSLIKKRYRSFKTSSFYCDLSRLQLRRIASETATRRTGNCDPLHPETGCIVPGTATRHTKKLLPDESKKLPVEVLKKFGNFAFCAFEKKPVLRFWGLFFKTRKSFHG